MLLNCDDVKNKRLYNEVRYARITCMSLKGTAAVFRLKRNHRNLSTEEYAENLISFLSNARLCKTITMANLTNIMHGIIGKSGIEAPTPVLRDEPEEEAANQTSLSSPDRSHIQYQCGEHVIAFWLEGNTAKWYLGVVEGISDGKILISYMSRENHGHFRKLQKYLRHLQNKFLHQKFSTLELSRLDVVLLRMNL